MSSPIASLLAPARAPDESFEAYRLRRRAGNKAITKYLRGHLSYEKAGERRLLEKKHSYRKPEKGDPVHHAARIIARIPIEESNAEAGDGGEAAASDGTPQQQGEAAPRSLPVAADLYPATRSRYV